MLHNVCVQGSSQRPLSRRLDRCDRMIQNESTYPNGVCLFSAATCTSQCKLNPDAFTISSRTVSVQTFMDSVCLSPRSASQWLYGNVITFDWSHSTTQGGENSAVGDHCIATIRPSGWFAHVFVNRPVLSKASKQRREIIEFVTKTTWSEAWRLQSPCRS